MEACTGRLQSLCMFQACTDHSSHFHMLKYFRQVCCYALNYYFEGGKDSRKWDDYYCNSLLIPLHVCINSSLMQSFRHCLCLMLGVHLLHGVNSGYV